MSPIQKPLTDTELELMTIVWGLGEATVNEVLDHSERKLAYTSVSTILRILEQKGVLTTRKQGRGHLYRPTLSKSQYERFALSNVVQNVFEGKPLSLVKQLLDTRQLNPDELNEMKKLLEERRGEE